MANDEEGEIAMALDATTRRALPLIYFGVGGFYLLLVVVTPFLPGTAAPGPELVARWAGTGVFGVLGGWFLRRFPAPLGWGNHLAGVLGVVVVLNSLFLVAETDPTFVFALVVSLLAFSLFLLSMPWVIGLVALAVGSWLYMADAAGWTAAWSSRSINLLAICALAILVQAMRIGLHRRLEALKAKEVAQAVREGELARDRALNDQRRRIVRMTAHELATPLTPVLMQAHALTLGPLSPEQRKSVESLQRSLDRLHVTIDKIVAAAQADEATAELYEAGDVDE